MLYQGLGNLIENLISMVTLLLYIQHSKKFIKHPVIAKPDLHSKQLKNNISSLYLHNESINYVNLFKLWLLVWCDLGIDQSFWDYVDSVGHQVKICQDDGTWAWNTLCTDPFFSEPTYLPFGKFPTAQRIFLLFLIFNHSVMSIYNKLVIQQSNLRIQLGFNLQASTKLYRGSVESCKPL